MAPTFIAVTSKAKNHVYLYLGQKLSEGLEGWSLAVMGGILCPRVLPPASHCQWSNGGGTVTVVWSSDVAIHGGTISTVNKVQ